MNNTGVIRVTATEKTEVKASGAKFFVSIEGESFVFGNAALDKSKDVRKLVGELKTAGASDDDIEIKSVTTRNKGGAFNKDTRATYHLVVKLKDIAKVGEYLAVIAEQKASASRIEWTYDDDSVLSDLAAKALQKAEAKASKMSSAINYAVIGLRSCSDTWSMPEVTTHIAEDYAQPTMARSKMMMQAAVDVGTEFKSTKEVEVTVTADFAVAKKDNG
jgi:uncharacterized protein YggE